MTQTIEQQLALGIADHQPNPCARRMTSSLHQNLFKADPWGNASPPANGEPIMSNFASWFGKSQAVDPQGNALTLFHSTFNDFDAFETTRDIGFHFGSAFIANKRIKEVANARGIRDAKHDGFNLVPVHLQVDNPFHLKSDPGAWEPDYLLRLLDSVISPAHREHIKILDEAAVDAARAQADLMIAAGTNVVKRKQPWTGGKTFVSLKQAAWVRLLASHRVDVYAALRNALKSAGHDGLTYINSVEGQGHRIKQRSVNPDNLCWVVFDALQIKSAVGNSGLFLKGSDSLTDRQSLADLTCAIKARSFISSPDARKCLATSAPGI